MILATEEFKPPRPGTEPRTLAWKAAVLTTTLGPPPRKSLKETKLFLPHPRVKVSIVGSLRDREVACSASDRQGSNFESCVWRTVSSQSSHHPQEVLLAQFSLYVHKGGLKPDSFHFHWRIHHSHYKISKPPQKWSWPLNKWLQTIYLSYYKRDLSHCREGHSHIKISTPPQKWY